MTSYAVVHIMGKVADVTTESTKSGKTATVLQIETGEWNGNPKYVRARFWGDARAQASRVRVGDMVAASGRVESRLNDRGFWNDSMSFQSCAVIQSGQSGQQDAYYSEDVPF